MSKHASRSAMRWIGGMMVCTWVSLVGCATQGAVPATPASGVQAPPPDSAQQLAALERETGQRWKAKDAAFFERFMVDDIIMNQPDGALQSKQEFLAELKRNYRVDLATNEDIVVRIHGTTAVVTGVVHNVGVYEGAPFDSYYRYVDTFVWTGDQWKNVAWAMVRLPDPLRVTAGPGPGTTPSP